MEILYFEVTVRNNQLRQAYGIKRNKGDEAEFQEFLKKNGLIEEENGECVVYTPFNSSDNN